MGSCKSTELLAVLLITAVAATGATLRPSPVVPSGFVDTESVTNAAIRAEALADARTFSGSITLDATVSNAVEVAFGIADPATGALAPGEESFAVGWDCGRLVQDALSASAPLREISYASDGHIAAISNAEAVVEYAYTPDGLDAGCTLALANGTVFTRTLVRDTYRRDLIIAMTNSVNGVSVEVFDCSHDAIGRPVSRNGDAFGYNARSEVIFSRRAAENAEETYSYDEIGNLLSFAAPAVTNAYVANNLNQYVSIYSLCGSAPLRELSYDPDGNLTQCGDWTYTYDAANHLVSVSSTGNPVASFAYDAQSRRVKKVTPEATHTFFYDGWNLVKETVQRSNGATVQRTYVWGKDLSGSLQGAGGVGGLLAVVIDGSPYFPTYDNNGNVTRYLDASGNTVAQYAYDAFGNITSATGPMADVFPHRFSTKYFDSETGLYYYGYRYYSPSLMRWLTRDPIEEQGGLNLYAFCNNSSTDTFDQDGCAYFAYRPLDGVLNLFGVVSSDEDERFNTVIGHEQLFFEDGKQPPNLGFFADGTVRPDNDHTNYSSPHSKGWKDCIMRQAVASVKPKPYCLLGKRQYNCQDWAEEVRRTYHRILRTGYP